MSPIVALAATPTVVTPEAREFFERKIRPVLAAECYECHGAEKQKGGLRLDSRPGWEAGGNLGDAIVAGEPAKSLLLAAIKHADPELAMPDKAPKLADAVIADFEQWIRMGAPDPRDQPSPDPSERPSWEQLFASRRAWWSLQSVKSAPPPAVRDARWSAHPVDRFLLAAMEQRGVPPVADTDPRTLLRRLTFTLIGLPPEPADIAAFVADHAADPQQAIARHTERLLASPRFGEHWARRWMDLVRYAESHGSEGDPTIPEAWRYRDYLIRAFNADVPLDQLVREQIAGDLLPDPRLSPDGFNESRIGPAQLRFVEHGFQPIDTLDDQVKTIDNQIDVVTKAFQGLTVSCARCHDHKFDAISQRDFTALYGVFASVRPAQVPIDTAERLGRNRVELERLHGQIRGALAEAWTSAADKFPDQLRRETAALASNPTAVSSAIPGRDSVEPAGADSMPPGASTANDATIREGWVGALREAASDSASPLHAWVRLSSVPAAEFPAAWTALAATVREREAARIAKQAEVRPLWNLAGDDYARWFPTGTGVGEKPLAAGEFAVVPRGERIIDGLMPAGAFTRRLSGKHHALLTSPRFKIEHDYLSVRVAGNGGAMIRVIVDHYPLQRNPIFAHAVLSRDDAGWVRLDTSYRKGSYAYVELATRDDLTRPFEDKNKKPFAPGEPSYFAAAEIVAHDRKDALQPEATAVLPLLEGPVPVSAGELGARYAQTIATAVAAWRESKLTEPQRAFLDFYVRRNLLPTTLDAVPAAHALVGEYRRLEAEVPGPRFVPGVIETMGLDAPLFVRGDHLQPADPVPRGYLSAIEARPFRTPLSGRLEFAGLIGNAGNPLTARVMANRIWQWVYGEGIVRTPDNFGRLGEAPTHPELLDFLAARLVANGWSLKEMIRFLVATRAFRLSSAPSVAAKEQDPANTLLSHARVRRLEAEGVRDTLLAVSGELQETMYGAAVAGAVPRRSVYVQIRRTKLDPFLGVFDAPAPFSTLGKRSETNVPAQALALLNAPFVIDRAAAWGRRQSHESSLAPDARAAVMFERALGRPPVVEERASIARHLESLAREHGVTAEALPGSEPVWRDFAHSIFNLKEFIYVR